MATTHGNNMNMLAADNQFSFHCPIFDVQTRFSACSKLRDLVYSGKSVTVRRGCQACMASSKCPAARAISDAISSREPQSEDYSSKTPVDGKLREKVLERIHPIIVQAIHLQYYNVPPTEADLIATANDRIAKQLGSAPKISAPTHRRAPVAPKPVAATPPVPSIHTAAATGDMSAAIS